MAEETKQQGNFKDQMRELSTVDISEYNKKVAVLKKKWFDSVVEDKCRWIKYEIKERVERGAVYISSDGKRVVSCSHSLSDEYVGRASWFNGTPDEEDAKKLYEQFRKIPSFYKGKIEKFFDVPIICCSPYVVYKCNVYKKRLLTGNIYNHTYEFYYGKRMLEFLNKLRERLSQDGIELRSITQKIDGTHFHDVLRFTKFDEHHIITAQDKFSGKDYSNYYDKLVDDDRFPFFSPELWIRMEV